DGRARRTVAAWNLQRVLPLLLRLLRVGPQRARRTHLVLVHDGERHARARGRLGRRATDGGRALAGSRSGLARPRRIRRALGAAELRAIDVAVPRRRAACPLL